ncbi:SPOR domain-containing protein [Gilvimarinus sp. DA14]|uniref:SPOR domain-containing protein n=1 Tax=Gilvimarinus sp. DA14 TaxID=2956798 RepID=UPI0020B89DBE|nr:hypothetical protein [Gilvimarinus sp. DA14]UTF59420.1 hypothetical protein NHM04_13190 [Gilvimarinus sp. DA14]
MRLIFFALLGLNVAALVLQLTVWQPEAPAGAVASSRAGGKSLVLLSEKGGGMSEPQVTPRQEQFVLSVDGQQLCDLVGPFARLLDAEYMQEALASMEVAAQVRELEVPEGVGYWVHLPPEPSKKEALQKLREVQAKQIDSYLIPRGELANGISFGMFTRRELADARVEDMKTLGYEVSVREVERTRKENWVLLAPGAAAKLDAAAWVELLGRENGVEKQQKYCSGVASG